MTDRKKVMPIGPDWRDGAQYQHLLDVDRPGWAWEWLRRVPGYVEEERNLPLSDVEVSAVSGMTILRRPPPRRGGPWGLCFRGDAASLLSFRQIALGSGF